jgi:hypothetical protein
MTTMSWLILGGVLLVGGILADDWYAKRKHRPLSKMKPDLEKSKTSLGMEEMDMTRVNRVVAENDRLNAMNSAKNTYSTNKIVPRLRVKRKEKDGSDDC